MKVIDGINQVDEFIQNGKLEFRLDFTEEDDINEQRINAVMTYTQDEGYQCFPIEESQKLVGFKALKMMSSDVVSIPEQVGFNRYKVYLSTPDDINHNCIIRLKNGRLTKPMSGAQARRAVKEGARAYHIDIVGPHDVSPRPGGYYIYRDAICGPFTEYNEKSKLYYAGNLIATTDEGVSKHNELTLKLSDNIIDYIINSPVIPLEIDLMTDSMGNIWHDEDGEIHYQKVNSYFLRSELDDILHKVMNLGMTLRQNQLNGQDYSSGNDVLNKWKEDNL